MIKLSFRDIEAQYALTTYHGTDGRFLPKILTEGLRASKPQGRFDKGVYMTSDLEKAARYAIDGIEKTHGIPVILQINISKDTRIKKIYRDPLDRDEDHLYDEYDNYNKDLQDLNRDINEVLKKSMPEIDFGYTYPLNLEDINGDLSKLRGINIYKNIINLARNKGADLNKVKKVLFSIIPPDKNYGNIIVSEDGTIKIDTSEIENMHQQIYPKKLPPSVIKAVWVANVPKQFGGERMDISSKLLPQESRAIFDDIRGLGNKYYWKKEINEDEVEDLINELEDINLGGWFNDDIASIKSDPSLDNIKEVLTSLEEFENDNALEGLTGKKTEFTKMAPQDALKYIQSITQEK